MSWTKMINELNGKLKGRKIWPLGPDQLTGWVIYFGVPAAAGGCPLFVLHADTKSQQKETNISTVLQYNNTKITRQLQQKQRRLQWVHKSKSNQLISIWFHNGTQQHRRKKDSFNFQKEKNKKITSRSSLGSSSLTWTTNTSCLLLLSTLHSSSLLLSDDSLTVRFAYIIATWFVGPPPSLIRQSSRIISYIPLQL